MTGRVILLSTGLLGLVCTGAAQYFIRNWSSTVPLTPFVNGANGSGPTGLVADDLDATAYAGQRITALNMGFWNMNSWSVTLDRHVSVYASTGSEIGPTGVANPGNLLLHRSGVVTVSPNNFHQTTWNHSPGISPMDAFVPNVPIWIGASFSGPSAPQLNQIGMFFVVPEETSSPAIFRSYQGTTGNFSFPDGGQLDSTGIYPSGDLSVSIGIQGQTFRSNVTWAMQPAAYVRRMSVTAKVGNKVLINRTNSLSAGSTNANFTFTVPATLPIGYSNPVTISLDGESFLRRSIIGVVPVPAPESTGPTINIASVTLVGGDCDNSGEIDAADIDFVIERFGLTFTATGPGSNADVDASGEVDAADIDTVIVNFGLVDDLVTP